MAGSFKLDDLLKMPFEIVRTGVTAAANSDVIIPAPTTNGNTVTYNTDPRITADSTVIPIADDNNGSPIKYKTCTTSITANGGYVTIKLAEAISNKKIGVVVFPG